jgi:hypothetical protein
MTHLFSIGAVVGIVIYLVRGWAGLYLKVILVVTGCYSIIISCYYSLSEFDPSVFVLAGPNSSDRMTDDILRSMLT